MPNVFLSLIVLFINLNKFHMNENEKYNLFCNECCLLVATVVTIHKKNDVLCIRGYFLLFGGDVWFIEF